MMTSMFRAMRSAERVYVDARVSGSGRQVAPPV